MRYSVITINYNNEDGLRQTINSIVRQTCDDFEFIIIDGGSTDGSVNVIKEYNTYVDYWVSERDNGIFHAMNKGVAQAHGDYCLFINSGDCFYDCEVLCRFSQLNYYDDIIVGKVVSNNNSLLFQPPMRDISLFYLYSGTVPHQGSFIRTSLLRKFPYDENLRIVSDWKFFVQAIIEDNCTVSYVDEIVAIFDTGGVSTANPVKMWQEKEAVLNRMFPSRILLDYQYMKRSECLTQQLTPMLRKHYRIDRFLYMIGKILLKFVVRRY
jgi:glycosyltransferase involved in cell wall biosynthesis